MILAHSMPRFHAAIRGAVTMTLPWGRALLRAIQEEGLGFRASSLAYTTLLTIVPGLAFSFSLLKAFGVNQQLRVFLLNLLTPLGDKAPILTDRILEFVTRVNVGVLGFMGLVSLIYVIVSMLGKIEGTFNQIWKVTCSRSFARRIGDHLSVVLLGPVLLFSALGVTASMPELAVVRTLVDYEPFATLFFIGGKLLSWLLVVVAFAFVYYYMPNTRVPWRAALFGGALGGLSWKLAGFWFAHFVAGSAQYHALYSSLVIVVLFMVWLELSWLILLLGGQAAMYFQHPYYLDGCASYSNLGGRRQEELGVSLMVLIAVRFRDGEPPWSQDALSDRLKLPWSLVKEGLERLQRGGLIEATGRGDDSYLPARDLAAIGIAEILDLIRGDDLRREGSMIERPEWVLPEVVTLLDEMEQAAAATPVVERSLRDLVESLRCSSSAACSEDSSGGER